MQKIRRFFTYILITLFGWSTLYPIVFSFSTEDKYDYSEFFDKINISHDDFSGNVYEGVLSFPTKRTTFILAFDNFQVTRAEDIEVEWDVDGEKFRNFLDIEGPDDYSRITTFPLVVNPRETISFRIISHSGDLPREVVLISSSQASQGKKIVFRPDFFTTSALEATPIVSRAEWGADESLRYISKEEQKRDKEIWFARGKSPFIIEETEQSRAKRIQGDQEYNAIISRDPEATSLYSLVRYEGSQKLIWPIKKSKKINRIVIHHTAENLEKVADDETLIRAIYLYHTRTKGWGDIGYNFIVGQRGKVYEGRAGGDYVEGAHVYGNNRGTVGISLIGNYEKLHLNKNQNEGMLNAIEYVVRKYGIDLSENAIGASLCGSGATCIWKPVQTSKLIGHRDLAATSCPGINLYSELDDFKSTIVGKVGKVQAVYNIGPNRIDPIDPEDIVEYRIKDSSIASLEKDSPRSSSGTVSPSVQVKLVPDIKNLLQSPKISPPTVSRMPLGPEVKIRLSYPIEKENIILESATSKNALLHIGKRKIRLNTQSQVQIQLFGSGQLEAIIGNRKYRSSVFSLQGDIIRIPSWSRIPEWDTTRKHNDNIFRTKITVRNDGGKLLVINELPLENYLKGMGEVSESVDVKNYPEKVKALIVAGRSYARYYQDPTLPLNQRKFQTRLYDISDDPDESQVYKGYGYELRSPNYVKLVEATNGEVVTYNGEVIKVWYFSSSDGRTLSYKEYCESRGVKNCQDIPYLQSVDDPAGVGKVRLGHGVGISGVGATYGASIGKTYKEIIQYYLKGVEISKK